MAETITHIAQTLCKKHTWPSSEKWFRKSHKGLQKLGSKEENSQSTKDKETETFLKLSRRVTETLVTNILPDFYQYPLIAVTN